MADLPTGTVTFLFTDIEGSTKLAQQFPALWEATRAHHHAILRAACEAHHGHVFQTIGDAFCVAFASAPDALAAALEAQRALHAEAWNEVPIKVRMGLHTGTAEAHNSEYRGYLTLAQVQRVMSMAHGLQILVSNATAALVLSQLPDGVKLRDLGEHRLKGLLNPEHLWQVMTPDLPQDFPPIQSLNTIPNNLPIQVTSFVGRERDLGELHRLLPTTRLLTLTGSGGTGKTRLSLQLATDVLDGYRDGVWFVELAPLSDPALVPVSVATVLGMREEPGRPLLTTLLDWLRPKQLLLILDNCEHLIETCARFADAVLHAGRETRILASSREALGIAGETAFRVPSLEMPNPTQMSHLSMTQLEQYAAVRLFIDRATQALTTFTVTNANAPTVAQICSRLDGIPLAIELAAARVKALRVEQIAERLDDRFRLLTGGHRTALPRQQTLRGTIDWSHSLLAEPERVLLRRLSVFVGGWTLAAAEVVCSSQRQAGSRETDLTTGYPLLTTGDILDLLTHLVDKSLVVVDEQSAAPRYHMLETIRQYAREKLLDADESERLRERHLAYYVKFAEEAEEKILGPDQVAWLNQLETELDNLRAAMGWSLQRAEPAPGLRLTSALWWFWETHTYHTEMIARLQELLEKQGAHARTRERAKALNSLGWLVRNRGNSTAASPNAREALAIGRELADPFTVAWAQLLLAMIASDQKDFRAAQTLYEECMTGYQVSGHLWHSALAQFFYGTSSVVQGDYVVARQVLSEGAGTLRGLGDLNLLAGVLRCKGRSELKLGLAGNAASGFAESVRLNIDVGDKRGILASMAGLAAVSAIHGKLLRAVRLSGAIEALQQSYHAVLVWNDRDDYVQDVAALRAQLAPDDFAGAWAAGRALTLDQAIALALEETNA